MACTFQSSFPFQCRNSNGGVQEIKVKVFDSAAIGTTFVETSGTIVASGSALTDWFVLYCEKMTANFVDAGTTSVQNGTATYKQTVTFIYNKLQIAFRNELKNYHQQRIHIRYSCQSDNTGSHSSHHRKHTPYSSPP